jgi:hypothetical protein
VVAVRAASRLTAVYKLKAVVAVVAGQGYLDRVAMGQGVARVARPVLLAIQ